MSKRETEIEKTVAFQTGVNEERYRRMFKTNNEDVKLSLSIIWCYISDQVMAGEFPPAIRTDFADILETVNKSLK